MHPINNFTSTGIQPLLMQDPESLNLYLTWLLEDPKGLSPAKRGLRTLGPAKYRWRRMYVWEQPFQVGNETWHWRLFASKRGLSLEIEDQERDPYGGRIREATYVGLRHFLAAWGSDRPASE